MDHSETVLNEAKNALLKECCEGSFFLRVGTLEIKETFLSRITLESLIRDYELVEQVLTERIAVLETLGGEPQERLSESYEKITNLLQQLRTLWDSRYHENKKQHDPSRFYWGVAKEVPKKDKK